MAVDMQRGVGTISLLMLGLIALAGCQRGIRTESIETTILQDLESQGEIPVASVSCPSRIQPEVGKSFSCVGELESGSTFGVTVTPQDETGSIKWEIPNSKGLLNLALLETYFQEEIATELGIQATIDCGSTYRVNRPGDSFDCAVANAIAPSEQSTPTSPANQTEQANQPTLSPASNSAEPVLVEVVVNVDQQGNVNWQQIRRVETAQATSTPSPAAPPAAASPTAAAAAPNGEQAVPAANPSSEAQTAEDFLDDPSALDDF